MTTEKHTILKDHITEILAILWTLAAIGITYLILMKQVTTDEKTVFLIIGNTYGIVMLMCGYYWGASKLSHTKSEGGNTIEGSDSNQININTK